MPNRNESKDGFVHFPKPDHQHEFRAFNKEKIIASDGSVADLIEVDSTDAKVADHLIEYHTDPDDPRFQRVYSSQSNQLNHRKFIISDCPISILPVEMSFFRQREGGLRRKQIQQVREQIEYQRSPHKFFLDALSSLGDYYNLERGDQVVLTIPVTTTAPGEEPRKSVFFMASDLVHCKGEIDGYHDFELNENATIHVGLAGEDFLELTSNSALIVSPEDVALRRAGKEDIARFKSFLTSALEGTDKDPIIRGGVMDIELLPALCATRLN